MTRISPALLVLVLPFAAMAHAPNSYIRTSPIGSENPEVPKSKPAPVPMDGFHNLKPEEWVGERVIFASKSRSLQYYGYQSVHKPPESIVGLPYEPYVGKLAVIKEVTQEPHCHEVELETEDGERLTAQAFHGYINGIIFLRDIDLARERYLGKHFWLMSGTVSTADENGDETKDLPVKRFGRVLVKDVVTGWYNGAPVRFILETDDGKEGYLDLQVSGTNVSDTLREPNSFSEHLVTKDPRILFAKWGKRTLDAIAAEKVFVGMTTVQAKMSWGDPDKVNATTGSWGRHEQWVYGDSSYLYFENGKLTSMQNQAN